MPDALEEALDDALRRRLTSTQRLRRRVDGLEPRGRRGIGALAALVEARVGNGPITESTIETRLFRIVRNAGLPLPEKQFQIRNRGRVVARPDFAYPDIKLAIEADGYRWHSGRVRWERDLARRNALTALGWRIVHVTSTDVDERADDLVGMIAGMLAADGARDGSARFLPVQEGRTAPGEARRPASGEEKKDRASPKARPRHIVF